MFTDFRLSGVFIGSKRNSWLQREERKLYQKDLLRNFVANGIAFNCDTLMVSIGVILSELKMTQEKPKHSMSSQINFKLRKRFLFTKVKNEVNKIFGIYLLLLALGGINKGPDVHEIDRNCNVDDYDHDETLTSPFELQGLKGGKGRCLGENARMTTSRRHILMQVVKAKMQMPLKPILSDRVRPSKRESSRNINNKTYLYYLSL